MCGIVGILNLASEQPVTAAPLERMAATLTHRGPDDAGTHIDPHGRCGLGFRRLSIIDVVGGHQPIANEDESVWLVFNGEIYNFHTLRKELEAGGHVFRTQTDSEVIVHLYEEHGEACFERLAGMFAIAIWDQRHHRLVLARDRFGKKPLTYGVFDGRLVFASEAKAILALNGVARKLNPQALHQYLVFQYVPAPHSIYRGFHKLLPGHCVSIDAGATRIPASQPYWQLRIGHFSGSYADALAELDWRLREAVRRRLISDVPLGAFLSGGVDSSIVVGLMRELDVSPLRTFSIGFADARYDETQYARQVAELYATEHHEHIVTPSAREILDTLAYHYDEPFADSSAIPTYYVAQWARREVTVALTGDAGDEAFGGYDRYRAAQLAAALDWLPETLRRACASPARWLPRGAPRTLSRKVYRFATAVGAPAARRYMNWVQIFDPSQLAEGYTPEFRRQVAIEGPTTWFESLYDGVEGSPAARAIYADLHSYLPYDLLTKVDIASMACSLECRSPLLDHELVEFAVSLPIEWRVRRRGGKRILKDWARARLPAAVLDRPKMGFSVPVGEWFRGELQDLLRDSLLGPGSFSAEIFRTSWLHKLVEGHLSGRENHEHALWTLLMLEQWHRCWQPG